MTTRRPQGTGSVYRPTGKGTKRRPYWIAWRDHTGKRQQRTTGQNDKAVAQRMLDVEVTRVQQIRTGLLDVEAEQRQAAASRPICDHLNEYIADCKRAGLAKHNINQKWSHLAGWIESQSLRLLADLTPEALTRHLEARQMERDTSARTWNFTRQNAVAFVNWCVKQGRSARNPLEVVSKQDERADRRKVRRPLTADELTRLFEVARERGRLEWYACAYYAGLRKGDLQRLRWSDVNFGVGTLTVRDGKAKRTDVLPMHPELADMLRARLEQQPAVGAAPVFRATVTDATRRKDFKRAGVAQTDEDGRTADLHALRTTLGTNLAREGVAPQIAQRIMRHADYKTTLTHYTVLGLTDTAAAVESLPGVVRQVAAATGTESGHAMPAGVAPVVAHRTRNSANRREAMPRDSAGSRLVGDLQTAMACDVMRPNATGNTKAGDAIRTRDIQLGRLTLYH
jgi:integrase